MTSAYAARRIACLQPSATVILDAIGELDRVVACTRYCADVVPAVADGSRLILADSWTADTAQIVAAHPDLVIASVPYQEKAVSEILRAGARFLGLAPKCLADIYTDIATIAGAVGAMDRADGRDRGDAARRQRSAPPDPRGCTRQESGVKNGASRSSLRRLGLPNWSMPPEANFWVKRAVRFLRKKSARWNPRSSSPRGAVPEIASRWKRSSPIAIGSRLPRRVRAASSACATNFSIRPHRHCCKVCTRWPSRFIPNSSRTPKASARLLPFRLPQPEARSCELISFSCPLPESRKSTMKSALWHSPVLTLAN